MVMMEDIAGIKAIGSVVGEHGWNYDLLLDKCLDFGQFFEVSVMPGGDVVVVVGEVVGVQMRTGFDHSFEVLVVLAIS